MAKPFLDPSKLGSCPTVLLLRQLKDLQRQRVELEMRESYVRAELERRLEQLQLDVHAHPRKIQKKGKKRR